MLSGVLILKTLDHPHILKEYEVFVESTSVSVVSELCAGMSSSRNNEIEALQRATRVAYSHDRCIVHHDLKPETQLLKNPSPKALLKVIDFGTSSKVDPESQLHRSWEPLIT